MLIPSERHRPEDLALWAELEETDAVHARRLAASGRIDAAMDVLTVFASRGSCYCGVSWGKDSVVVARLLRSVAPRVPLVYLRQSTENPDCLRVRDCYFAAFPDQPYEEVPVTYASGASVSHANPAWNAAIASCRKRWNRSILGIRASESMGRKIRMFRWSESSPNACAPIGWWSVADVFAYLWLSESPVHPVYAMLGGGRWSREHLRVASIGGRDGDGHGRREWEYEYYSDVTRRLEAGRDRR
ncbi:MAG: hypothetical protein AB7G11_02445 [Phycisphaerales bacterium]